jgi:hypothetical protein
MSNLIFSQGQKDEALEWYEKNCPDLHKIFTGHTGFDPNNGSSSELAIDAYFKLKNISFDFQPTEFVVGIEYKKQEDVIAGTENVNIRFQNPHKLGKGDPFAQQVVIELLNRLKS